MGSVYQQQQQCHFRNWPTELFAGKESCEYRDLFNNENNVRLERKGIIVYTASAVIEFTELKGLVGSNRYKSKCILLCTIA